MFFLIGLRWKILRNGYWFPYPNAICTFILNIGNITRSQCDLAIFLYDFKRSRYVLWFSKSLPRHPSAKLVKLCFFSLTYGLQCIEMLLGPFPSHVVSERSSGGLWRSAIMAEVIQERVEDRLPELEQLERTGLFSHAEIKWESGAKRKGWGGQRGGGGGYRGPLGCFFSNMAEGRLQILTLSRSNFLFIARGSVFLPCKQYVFS